MTRPAPIFVLGIQRSGTTFAANLLAAHPAIAAVAAARHRGVHESVFFSHFARVFGDWSDEASRSAAVGAFLQSDYFVLCDLDAKVIGPGMQAAPTPGAAFRLVMDALALREGAGAWIEKSPHHTLLADDIARDLPEAHFLCITRGMEDFVRSRLWSFGRRPPGYPRRALLIARACASNAFHDRYMKGLARRLGPGRVHRLTYAALKADPDLALDPLLRGLGLPPLAGRRPAFAPNSSFADEAARKAALTGTDRALIALCTGLVGLVPQPLLQALQRRLSRRRPAEFPQWVRTPEIAGLAAARTKGS